MMRQEEAPMSMFRTLGLATLALLGGCDKMKAGLSESAMKETMGAYAAFFNATVEPASGIVKGYFNDLPADAKKFDAHYSFPFAPSADPGKVARATKALADAKKSAPDDMKSIAPLADSLNTTAQALGDQFKAVKTYYDTDRWKDDGGKQGAEMHQKMLASIKAYRDAVGAMQTALNGIEDRIADKELAQYADTKGARYYYRKLLGDAKRVLDAGQRGDAAAIRAKQKAFAATLGEADAAAKQPDANGAFKGFVSSAASFGTDAERFARAAEQNTPDAKQEFTQLVANYNGLVNVSNGLRTLEANNQL
jgi:hypothetical protein